ARRRRRYLARLAADCDCRRDRNALGACHLCLAAMDFGPIPAMDEPNPAGAFSGAGDLAELVSRRPAVCAALKPRDRRAQLRNAAAAWAKLTSINATFSKRDRHFCAGLKYRRSGG